MKNDFLDVLERYLPIEIICYLRKKPNSFLDKLCEIRIIREKPVMLDCSGELIIIENEGKRLVADFLFLQKITDAVTNGSLYSVNETIKNGFVTIEGGHRIGFCGTAVIDSAGVRHIKNISSVCIRISHEIVGCGLQLLNELYVNGHVSDILIASPPGCGKTTMLRDICRLLGNGTFGRGFVKVGIADERNEIASVYMGLAQNDIGTASFVCDGYEKSKAINMMLRAMSPDVIATDEIGSKADFDAVYAAKHSGVSVVATAHAYSFEDLCNKYGKEIISNCFDRVIILKDKGSIFKIYRREDNDY